MLGDFPFCSRHVGYHCIQPSLTQDKSSLRVAASEVLISDVMHVQLSGIKELMNVTSVFRIFPQQILASFHGE